MQKTEQKLIKTAGLSERLSVMSYDREGAATEAG
jgi:hypothetical protein